MSERDGGDVERKVVPLAEARAGVKLRAGQPVVLVIDGIRRRPDLRSSADRAEAATAGEPRSTLTILAADGTPGHEPAKLRLGAGSGLQLKWSVTAASKAALTAKSLVGKTCETSGAPSAPGPVSNDQLVSSALDLPLDAQGSGSGIVRVDPGPCGSTEYTLSVTPKDASAAALTVQATAFVANFNVQLELPDGSDYARNKPCVLEIPGQSSVEGTTNERGELWLWVPNVTAESATLRLLDGGAELAHWTVMLSAEEGVPSGALAVNDAGAAGADRVA
jgi:hypothetical protein